MGQSPSKTRTADEEREREEIRAALTRAREDHETFEKLRSELHSRAGRARVNEEQPDSSVQSAEESPGQITNRTAGDGNDLALAQILALRLALSQRSEESGASTSGVEVSLITEDEDSDSDSSDDDDTAINTLLKLGLIARAVAQLQHGEEAKTILYTPSLGTRVGRRSGEGNSNEVEAGTVVGVIDNLTFDVIWDRGDTETFLVGCKDKMVAILDCAPAGIQHPHIKCNACPIFVTKIKGTRWKCLECFDYDLCTSCYMNNKHNTDHRFIRFDKENFNGYCVPPRSSSNEVVQSVGLFPGAIVQRGQDWTWDNQDGGVGNFGKILGFETFSDERPRSGVSVQWARGGSNSYRIGFGGYVDLKCVTAAKGLPYYWDHLLTCGDEPADPKPVFDHHQRVKCTLSMSMLKSLMEEEREWEADVAEFIGKDGIVEGYMANNDVIVQYLPLTVGEVSTGQRCVWIFPPTALKTSASTAPLEQQMGIGIDPSVEQRPKPSISGQTSAPASSGPPSMCQSCDEEYASVTFHPCGHNLVCEACSVRMKKCMSCQTNIASKTHVVIRKPAAAVQEANGNRECEICMEEVKVTAFVPCGHGACLECSRKVDQCHICRAQITSKVRTYF